jgi:hypothetical protein
MRCAWDPDAQVSMVFFGVLLSNHVSRILRLFPLMLCYYKVLKVLCPRTHAASSALFVEECVAIDHFCFA